MMAGRILSQVDQQQRGSPMADRSTASERHFKEGMKARAAGKVLDDNPYGIRTDEHEEWAAGWSATFDLDEDDDPASDREPRDVPGV